MKRKVSLILSFIMIASIILVPMAAASMDSSNYLASYYAAVSVSSSGTVTISYQAIGKAAANESGAKKIVLYELREDNVWHKVHTFTSTDDPNMISHTQAMLYAVTYNGNASYQYYADVTFYAGYNGVGETRPYTAY